MCTKLGCRTELGSVTNDWIGSTRSLNAPGAGTSMGALALAPSVSTTRTAHCTAVEGADWLTASLTESTPVQSRGLLPKSWLTMSPSEAPPPRVEISSALPEALLDPGEVTGT